MHEQPTHDELTHDQLTHDQSDIGRTTGDRSSHERRSQDAAGALAPRLALMAALADDEHLTRVADRLGVPQPTVSRWLAEISERLGTPVVAKSGRGIRLTRSGRLLADSAGSALAVLAAGYRRALADADPESGQVSLAFLHTMGGVRVPELLSAFRAEHPGTRFTLNQAPHGEILAQLADGVADLVMTAPIPDDDAYGSVELEQQPLVLAVPATSHWAHRKRRRRVRIAELADEDFIGLKPGSGVRVITEQLCSAAGFTPRLAFEGEDTGTVRGLVAAGFGVAVLPIAEPAPPPGIVELALDPPTSRTIGLIWSTRHPLTAAARTFRDFVATRTPTPLH